MAWDRNWICLKNVPAWLKPFIKNAEVMTLLKAENDNYDSFSHYVVYEYTNKAEGYKAKVGISLEITNYYTKRGRQWSVMGLDALNEQGKFSYKHELAN